MNENLLRPFLLDVFEVALRAVGEGGLVSAVFIESVNDRGPVCGGRAGVLHLSERVGR